MWFQKFILPLRSVPYLSLAEDLRHYNYSGLFEIHVTVKLGALSEADYTQQLDNFRAICKSKNVKPLLIELENLTTDSNHSNAKSKLVFPTQMMTSSYVSGTFSKQAFSEAFRLARELAVQGYHIARVKVEAMLSDNGVPENGDEAVTLPVGNYFEFHVKVPLGIPHHKHGLEMSEHMNCPSNCIWKLCSGNFHAHLSRNAFKVHTHTQVQERFATMRMYKIGKDTALSQFNAFLTALTAQGYEILSKQREYSVYDSNVALDQGWIDLIPLSTSH